MRWLVRLSGHSARHLAEFDDADGHPPAQEGTTTCGRSGRLMPERPVAHISRDELATAALGVCPRCLSG